MGCCYSIECSKCGCPLSYYTGNYNEPKNGKKRSFRKSCRVHDCNIGKCSRCKENVNNYGCYHNWDYKLTIPISL